MSQEIQKLTLQGVIVKRDDPSLRVSLPCLPNVPGGCSLERRAQLGRFLAPNFPGVGAPMIGYGGYVCGLPRGPQRGQLSPPEGCQSGPDQYPTLSVDIKRFDETVQVVKNDDGSTSFIFK